MSNLWDRVDAEDDDDAAYEDETNSYLNDPEKGWGLLAQLLPGKKGNRKVRYAARRLDWMLDEQLIDTLHELKLEDPAGYVRQVERLSDRLMDYGKLRLLRGKALVGLGGQFSAGKSSFINSVIGQESKIQLPEDQIATTAIPTYVVSGEQDEIHAFGNGAEVSLDVDAMKALTHEFYDKYKIALGRFVDYIAIQNASFPKEWADKIAFLDTPGYNKSEAATKQELTDKDIAERQLRNADALIWLVHIKNGTIVTSDLEFLRSIDSAIPKLIVFTHADEQPQAALPAIVEGGKAALDDAGIPCFAVTAYDSRTGCEQLGKDNVRQFLSQVSADRTSDARQELRTLMEDLEQRFQEAKKEIMEDRRVFGHAISHSRNVRAIGSLTKLYRNCTLRLERLLEDRASFYHMKRNMETAIRALYGGEAMP